MFLREKAHEDITNKIFRIEAKLDTLESKRKELEEELQKQKKRESELSKELTLAADTCDFLKVCVNTAQYNLINYLQNVVDYVISYIYEEEHHLEIKLVEKRGSVEAEFYLTDKTATIQLKKPFIGKGGGKVSMVSLALYLAIIEYTGVTGPIMLDEVTKFVDAGAVERVASLLAEWVAAKKGRQIIHATHHEALSAEANNVLRIKKVGGVSQVTSIAMTGGSI